MYSTNDVITLADGEQNSTLDAFIARIKKAFNRAVKRVYKEKGYNYEMLKDKEIKALIKETDKAFQKAISYGIKDNVIPAEMQNSLLHNAFMFSGFKVHHELSEVKLSLFDDKGNIKGFDAFQYDVKKINSEYNENYLKAEYQFAISSSQSAANFARDSQDEDRYFLQYRTADDDRVRESHKELEGITLPASDPFWSKYYPPNGWNCRCFVNQVRRTKYQATNPEEAMKRGELATTQLNKNGKNKAAIFRFNPGQTGQLFPPKHPYFPKGCGDCPCHDITLAYKPDSPQCQACKIITQQANKSMASQEREQYLNQMKPLLEKKTQKEVDEKSIMIGYTAKGNRHLYSDTFGRSSNFDRENLKDIDKYLKNSTYVKSADLSKSRSDNITKFYYFKDKTNEIYYNVAEKVYKGSVYRFLYSITDKIKD